MLTGGWPAADKGQYLYDTAGINDAIPGLVATRPYTVFADLAKTTAFTKADWSEDNLRPSQQGYEKMAIGWFDALKPTLAARR